MMVLNDRLYFNLQLVSIGKPLNLFVDFSSFCNTSMKSSIKHFTEAYDSLDIQKKRLSTHEAKDNITEKR